MTQASGASYDLVSDENWLADTVQWHAQAHWLDRSTISWPINLGPDVYNFLHFAPQGILRFSHAGIQGGASFSLNLIGNSLSKPLAERFPHLRNA